MMKRACILITTLLTLAGCATPRPPDHQSAFSSVAFSPGHSLLAFADATEIRVLETGTRKPVNTLRQLPQDTVNANRLDFRHGMGDTMAFLDEDRIATTGMGGLVTVWDIRTGKRLFVIDPPAAEMFASTIDYSPASGRLVVGTGEGEILLTQLSGNTAGPLLPVAGTGGFVWDLQFGPHGRYFASASMTARNKPGDAVGIDPAAGQINEGFSAGENEEYIEPERIPNVAIWDAESVEKVGDLDGAYDVYRMTVVPGERTLVTAGADVRVWEFLTLEQAGEVTDPNMVLQGIGVGTLAAVSVIGLAAGAALGAPFMLVDPFTATQLMLLPVAAAWRPEVCFRSVAVSPDGKTIVSTTKGPSHNVMAVIDRASDKVVDKWRVDMYVCDVEFSPDGKYLLTATSSGVVIYDTEDWRKANLETIRIK